MLLKHAKDSYKSSNKAIKDIKQTGEFIERLEVISGYICVASESGNFTLKILLDDFGDTAIRNSLKLELTLNGYILSPHVNQNWINVSWGHAF